MKALFVGLWVAKELGVQDLEMYSGSQLVIRHIKGDYEAWKENKIKYLTKVKDLASTFHSFEI